MEETFSLVKENFSEVSEWEHYLWHKKKFAEKCKDPWEIASYHIYYQGCDLDKCVDKKEILEYYRKKNLWKTLAI